MSIACLTLLIALTQKTEVTWTVTNLNPDGATSSSVLGASGKYLVGKADFSRNSGGAILWSVSPTLTWKDLTPPGAAAAVLNACHGENQFGTVIARGQREPHVGLWSGSADSFVDLHPESATLSDAAGMDGKTQVGMAKISGSFHASLWKGSAKSWVDLHPKSGAYVGSIANGVCEEIQVGTSDLRGRDKSTPHAGLWKGTAESWVDLNPRGAKESFGQGAGKNIQAGTAYYGTGGGRATIWRGTAASAVNLHPIAKELGGFSDCYGAWGNYQVGHVYFSEAFGKPTRKHASLWAGSAESWVDLSRFLPSVYRDSEAYAMSSDGKHVYVSGYAYRMATGRWEAVLWTQNIAGQ
ncbi:MAG: hypothetical protein K8R88_10770 [Armatimonadetes bacterium]|nr:hypothetical protein [Armatimonadota bacterium]